jgi:predicted DNA-binding ribbon-helix-helix protein
MPAPTPFFAPQKHSLSLHGHRTSVSLEPEFWAAFRSIAVRRGLSISALAVEIDAARGPDVGLASAIRVMILRDLLQNSRDTAALSGSDGTFGPNS